MNNYNLYKCVFTIALLTFTLGVSSAFAVDSATTTSAKKIQCKLSPDLLGAKEKAESRVNELNNLLKSGNCKNETALNKMKANDEQRILNINNLRKGINDANDCPALGTLAAQVKQTIENGTPKLRPYDGIGPTLYKDLLARGKVLKCDSNNQPPKIQQIWINLKKTGTGIAGKETQQLPQPEDTH